MRIAVVGATGNIGMRLCRALTAAGHEVRGLTRGGRSAQALAATGATPFSGSFEEGADPEGFFDGADAAFVMVKTNWTEPDHYRIVGARIAAALSGARVPFVVNLSSIGADLAQGAGHVSDFHQLEQALDAVSPARLVHLRCAWFMENFLRMADSVARTGRMTTMLKPDLSLSCIATRDIADAAARLLMDGVPAGRSVVELHGAEDLTLPEIVGKLSAGAGRPIRCLYIDTGRADVRDIFLAGFGTAEVWRHRVEMYDAFNEGRVRWREARNARNTTPTTFDAFVAESWIPAYRDALANNATIAPTFESVITDLVEPV